MKYHMKMISMPLTYQKSAQFRNSFWCGKGIELCYENMNQLFGLRLSDKEVILRVGLRMRHGATAIRVAAWQDEDTTWNWQTSSPVIFGSWGIGKNNRLRATLINMAAAWIFENIPGVMKRGKSEATTIYVSISKKE